MIKVVITGGAGFIGSHLAEGLAMRGYHIIVLDDLSTGKMENIESLLNKDNAEFVEGSITDLPLLQKLFQDVDYVFHQAAIPSVPRSIDNPQASHEANATGTLNVLLASRDCGVKKVIYASSGAVYGDTPALPKKEDMVSNPLSPYAVTKLTGEHYCQVFQGVYGLQTVSLRYFNVYGPRKDPDSPYAAVIPKFIKRVITGTPPVIYGDGEQTRDFTFVKDVVEANIVTAENNVTGVFNIGRGERVTVNYVAKLIIGLVGNGVGLVYDEARQGDIRDSLADISRARAFGYNPKWSLEDGLRETVRSFQHEV